MIRIEHNVETGEVKEIQLSAKEKTELESLYAESAKIEAELKAELASKELAKAELLNRLGINADEAKLLLS